MCENATGSRSWTAGCGESSLSGAGSAGRKSTVERQHGRRPSTPFRCRDATALHVHSTLARVQGPALIRDEVVQVRQAGEKRRLTPTGVMASLHGEQLPVDGSMRL